VDPVPLVAACVCDPKVHIHVLTPRGVVLPEL